MPEINLNKKEIEFVISCLKKHVDFIEGHKKVACIIYNKLCRALRPIKISSRKAKGRALQKWMCEQISTLIGIPYNQQDDNCLIHSREMGQSGTDVVLRGEALKRFPFSIECKNCEKLNLRKSIEQAIKNKNQKEGTDWLVLYKRNSFKEPVVIISWLVFVGLCSMANVFKKE